MLNVRNISIFCGINKSATQYILNQSYANMFLKLIYGLFYMVLKNLKNGNSESYKKMVLLCQISDIFPVSVE